MAMTKVKNLQLWCKKMTDGYRDVDVKDMTSSWKNGLAFCALIHKFRPDLIDYDSLSKENVLENNQLAFDVAEKELNIPAFLDAPDMVAIKVPDRLSVVTYVSQYYNNLHDKPQLGGPGVKKAVATKRHQPDNDPVGPDAKRLTPSHANTHTPSKERHSMGDKCHICGEKVYLMERHVDKNKLFHRHCFRHSDLSPTSKVFNKSELKKITDKVKSENEAKSSSEKTDTKPNFWQRRNEAKRMERMEIENNTENKQGVLHIPEKDNKTEKKNDSKLLPEKEDKTTEKKEDKLVPEKENRTKEKKDFSDFRKSSEITSHKKDRPLDLKVEAGVKVKKSHDIKPTPRKHKVHKSEPEPMETNEVNEVKLKPVPTPRNPSEEKDHSRANNFLLKTKNRLKEKNHSSSIEGKQSPVSPLTPSSPPPLPSQPPPSELIKSDLTSPKHDIKFSAIKGDTSTVSSSVTVDLRDKSKSSDIKSSGISAKSSRNSESPDRGYQMLSSSGVSGKYSANSKSPKASPRSPHKFDLGTQNSNGHRTVSPFSPTSKHSTFDDKVNHAIEVTKNSSNSHETVAVVFQPSQKQQEENDKQVLGGLLSNLANIRRKKISETSPVDEPQDSNNQNRGQVKSAILTNTVRDNDQKHSVDKDSSVKNDSNVPEWKRQLERNKVSRPKSADILSDKKERSKSPVKVDQAKHRPKTEVTQRPKSADLLADKFKTEQKPQWQIEAEKRMEARKGGYKDPEKRSVVDTGKQQNGETDHNRKSAPIKPSRVDIKIIDDKQDSSNINKRVLPSIPNQAGEKKSDQEKKKISVNVKFDFSKDGGIIKQEKVKPPRPPPISPGSHRSPARPPPPLKDADHKRLSPADIQRQLTEIDSRLTDLEIRGRQLEDSIRKAKEEEDDKMMVEWFDLVNNKNELVRKEADLIYLSRAQELEDEQLEIDNQLRSLMCKADKTEEDTQEEEQLIQRKLDVINQRNVIVDSIDEDRIRYEEEDKDIAMALQALTDESGHISFHEKEAKYTKKKKKKK